MLSSRFSLHSSQTGIIGSCSKSIFINSRKSRNLSRSSSLGRLEFEAQHSPNRVRQSLNPRDHSIFFRNKKSIIRSILRALAHRPYRHKGHTSSFYNSLVVTRGPSSVSGVSFHIPSIKDEKIYSRSKIRTSRFFRLVHMKRLRMSPHRSLSLIMNDCFQGRRDYRSIFASWYSGQLPPVVQKFVTSREEKQLRSLLKRRPYRPH